MGFDEIQNSRRKYPVQQIKLSQKKGERNFRLLKIYKLQICERELVEPQTQENVAKLKGIQLYCNRSRATWFEQVFSQLKKTITKEKAVLENFFKKMVKTAQTPTPF